MNRRGEKTFQASQGQLHATVGKRRRWVVEHDMKPADTIQIVYDGRVLHCAPQEDTVATKIRDRDGKRGRLKQAAKLDVFQDLRLASGESGGGISVGNRESNGVIKGTTRV